MRKIYQHFLIAAGLMSASLALPGCEKDSGKSNGSVGNIRGKVSPVAAVSKITARDSSNSATTFDAQPNAASGEFTFFDVKPGTYSVSFTTTSGFAQPTNRVARVVAGETTDLGTITIASSVLGDIRGYVKPQGAISRVMASSGGRSWQVYPSTTTGEYRFTGLAPGNYQLTFSPTPRYRTPAPVAATVVVSQTVFADTVRAILNEGTITGRVTPATSALRITATDSLNRDFITTADASGRFTFSGLRPSQYRISCLPASGSIPPQVKTAQLRPEATVDVGAFTILSAGNPSTGGTFVYKVNTGGTLITKTATNIRATRSGAFLIISGSVGTETVSLALSGVTGNGVISLSGTGNASYGSYQKGSALWTTSLVPGGQGSVNITNYSTNPRKVSGSFNLVKAAPANMGASGSGVQSIVNGVMTDVTF